MGLPQFAEKFAIAGFVVSLFDYRYLGASEGEPRGQILPKDFLAAPGLTAAV
jgi:hypothetical protein